MKKMVNKLSDAASIEAIAESSYLTTVNWRMKRRFLQKIRSRAAQLGYDSAELEKKLAPIR